MMAVMLVASATAFAGDSDALKAILKAKTYAEAEQLVKSSIDQLANAQEKAKAYNKLVDLAYEAFSVQSTLQTENKVAKQMGKEEKPIDEKLMSEMAFAALSAAAECDKYDQQPNEKGKVSPKFAKKNAERLWFGPRNQLVNAGDNARVNKDQDTAYRLWSLFVESNESPLFAECNRDHQKQFFGQIAYLTAYFAKEAKEVDKAIKYCEVAMKDSEYYENGLNLKLEILGDGLKTKEDSVKYVDQLKGIYAEHKVDGVMEKIYNTLLGMGEKDAAFKVLDDALAENPNNFVALADKGLGLLNEKPAEAATYLKKACELKNDNAALQAYTGQAICIQAQNTEDPNAQKALYKEAIKYLDKAKELDPDRLHANWGYVRLNAYYNYYGEDAPETKQAEADSK